MQIYFAITKKFINEVECYGILLDVCGYILGNPYLLDGEWQVLLEKA